MPDLPGGVGFAPAEHEVIGSEDKVRGAGTDRSGRGQLLLFQRERGRIGVERVGADGECESDQAFHGASEAVPGQEASSGEIFTEMESAVASSGAGKILEAHVG